MNIHALLTTGVVAALITATAPSQEAEDHIGHERHLHRHNDPHEVVVDASRFHTSREGRDFPLPNEEDAFTFAVFGDRTGGPVGGVAVLADAVHDVNLFEPDLVMTVGDLVQGYTNTPNWLAQMREFRGIMDQLLCPWFPVAGNHDIYWPNGPAAAHEPQYEMHFGPLWYAFEHKSSWFIALHSDEGNPETGQRSFRDAEAQRMSEAQFTWLMGILEEAKDADHIFVFLHHPRWLEGNYGDDWRRVHEAFVEAGNVSAVFAGHIHHMRYDPRDGIEYITLATVGGGQAGHVPEAGWLHHYHMVTVREDQIAIAGVPVGEVLDPREITGEVSGDTQRLKTMNIPMRGNVALREDGSVESDLEIRIPNRTARPVEFNVFPDSRDSRWSFSLDHKHRIVEPGDTLTLPLRVTRGADEIDDAFRMPRLAVQSDYLTDGFRYSVPERRIDLPFSVGDYDVPEAPQDMTLQLDGNGDALVVPSEVASLPDGPFTLEAWFTAEQWGERVGIATKTQGSEYGFLVSEGSPQFLVHLDGEYVTARATDVTLETGVPTHLAGVFDGERVRLYVNGERVASLRGSGARTLNELPLMIGADPDGDGAPMSFFQGEIHEVRLSTGVRYRGESFTPEETLALDDDCVFLTRMDKSLMRWVIDLADSDEMATLRGNAALVERE